MKRFSNLVVTRHGWSPRVATAAVSLFASRACSVTGSDNATTTPAAAAPLTPIVVPTASPIAGASVASVPTGAAALDGSGARAVFLVDIDVKSLGPLGVDYDPAEFVVSLLEVKADGSQRTSKVTFNGVMDPAATAKLRKALYPAPDREGSTTRGSDLSPDVKIDASNGSATGGREFVYTVTARTLPSIVRTVMKRASAGPHSMLPVWRLPPGDGGQEALQHITGLKTFLRQLNENCEVDGGFFQSISRIVTHAKSTDTPLDSASDRPSATLPIRSYHTPVPAAKPAAAAAEAPAPPITPAPRSVPLVTPQRSIADEGKPVAFVKAAPVASSPVTQGVPAPNTSATPAATTDAKPAKKVRTPKQKAPVTPADVTLASEPKAPEAAPKVVPVAVKLNKPAKPTPTPKAPKAEPKEQTATKPVKPAKKAAPATASHAKKAVPAAKVTAKLPAAAKKASPPKPQAAAKAKPATKTTTVKANTKKPKAVSKKPKAVSKKPKTVAKKTPVKPSAVKVAAKKRLAAKAVAKKAASAKKKASSASAPKPTTPKRPTFVKKTPAVVKGGAKTKPKGKKPLAVKPKSKGKK